MNYNKKLVTKDHDKDTQQEVHEDANKSMVCDTSGERMHVMNVDTSAGKHNGQAIKDVRNADCQLQNYPIQHLEC